MGPTFAYAAVFLAVFAAINAQETEEPGRGDMPGMGGMPPGPRPSGMPPRRTGMPPRPTGMPPRPSGRPPMDRDICTPESRSTEEGFRRCIGAIRRRMQDRDAFWFGEEYQRRCQGMENTLECFNFDPSPSSMAERMFGEIFDPSTITSYLDIDMYEKPGQYKACGNVYTMEDEAIHKLNPIVPAPLTPWQTSQGFMASIQGMETELGRRLSGLFAGLGIRRETKYTLMVVDPGYFNLHALYIDIPVGADGIFDYMQGKEVIPYFGPLYLMIEPFNPYVFMVFRQERSFRGMLEDRIQEMLEESDISIGLIQKLLKVFGQDQERSFKGLLEDRIQEILEESDIDITLIQRLLQRFMGRDPMMAEDLFNVLEYVNENKLSGPIAVNWLMATGDIYAAGIAKNIGFVNVCPAYVATAARELDFYHIPDDATFDVSLDITYGKKEMELTLCCYDFDYEEFTADVNPIGNGQLSSYQTSNPPMVMLTKMKIDPTPMDFIRELYTLVLIDGDWDGDDQWAGTSEDPLILWMVTNIRAGRVRLGRTVLPYFIPEGYGHQYQFLLYKQMGPMMVNTSNYGNDCVLPEEQGGVSLGLGNRCLFDLEDFVEEKELHFAGASWFNGTTDEIFLGTWFIEQGWITEEEICTGVYGYEDPCPMKPGEHPGMCPMVTEDEVGTCVSDCENDMECHEMGYKCCSNGCGQVCMPAANMEKPEDEEEEEGDEGEEEEEEGDEGEEEEEDDDEEEDEDDDKEEEEDEEEDDDDEEEEDEEDDDDEEEDDDDEEEEEEEMPPRDDEDRRDDGSAAAMPSEDKPRKTLRIRRAFGSKME